MKLESIPDRREDILIVDDSPDNLRVLSTTLTKQGYGVRCAKSGSMALIGIQTFPPDLILLDIRMPVMDGYEVCQKIKSNPQTQDIAIIFLSALDDVLDKVKAFQAGGADYITKPFETEEVLARVKHQLLIRRLQQQLTQQNQQLLQEISDRKQIEEALRQEINQRILTEAALQDAKEVAEAANYAKSEFLARMSHELRTPLNAILGFTQLMTGDPSLTSENQEYIDTIHQNGQRLLKLVNNILSFTHVESSHLTLNERCFDLVSLLDALEVTWRPKATSKQLHLIVERAPGVPRYVRTDESKLRQVLTSLLENAVTFTAQGHVALRISIGQGDWSLESGSHTPSLSSYPLYFEVEDTGCSMASHEIEQSFQAFSQTVSGHKTGHGLGLGLSISRQFVHLMGGTMTAESPMGKGTIVKFHIQAYPVQVAELPPVITSTAACKPVECPLQKPAVLPVEVLTPDLLQAAMPLEWVGRLHQAAIRGFDQSILQLIQEMPISHTAIATTLAHWSRNFQFENILALTQPIVEEGLSHAI